MPASVHTSGVQQFAEQLGGMVTRISALERMSGKGGGGGGTPGDTDLQFWNSAWGVLVHTPSPATVVTVAATSTPIVTSTPVQLYAGRRYRVRGGVRAWQTTPATGNSDLTLVVSGPFAPGSNSHDQYATTGGGYSQAEWVAVFDCTADTPGAVYALTGTTTVAATLYGGGNAGLTVEDVGPITKLPTTPPPPAIWTPFDDRYVNVDGDAMTGKLQIQSAASGELLKLVASNPADYAYIGFYDELGARHGWLGKLASAAGPMYFASDAGLDINVVASAALNLSAGAGGVNIPDPSALFFGSNTRQMLNLYSNAYALGVQSSTLYFRGAAWSWHRGGVHSNTANDPGAGGVENMRLASGGLTVSGSANVLTLVGTGAASYIAYHMSGTIAAPTTRSGYLGYTSAASFLVNNEVAAGAIYMDTGAGGAIYFRDGAVENSRIEGGGIQAWARASSTYATEAGFDIRPDGRLISTRDVLAGYNWWINIGAADAAGSIWHTLRRTGSVQIGTIAQVSTTGTAYNTTSHGPWKGNVKRLDGLAAMERVASWPVVSFQWKRDADGNQDEDGKPSGPVQHGFVAQELIKVAPPGAVTPGFGKQRDHKRWIKRRDKRAREVVKRELEQREWDFDEALQRRKKRPVALTPFDEPEPFLPWGTDNSYLVPDLAAAVQGLIELVKSQADELSELRQLIADRS